jgi:hypothetical protein
MDDKTPFGERIRRLSSEFSDHYVGGKEDVAEEDWSTRLLAHALLIMMEELEEIRRMLAEQKERPGAHEC